MVLISCGGFESSSENSNEFSKITYSADFGKYSEVGKSVALYLEQICDNASEARSALVGEEEANYEIQILPDDITSVNFLLSNGYISKEAASYIERLENVIQDANDAVTAVNVITEIERFAVKNLVEEDLENVMNYAEVAKATIAYFASNDDSFVARFSLKRMPRWAKAAVSAGLGVVAGGFVGSQLGTVTLPVLGTVSGAGAGAIICGVWSGINGYKDDSIAVVVTIKQ